MTNNMNVLGSNKNIPGSLNQGKQANTQSKQLSTVNNTTNRPIAQSSMSGKRFHLLSDGVVKLEDGSKTPVCGYLEVVVRRRQEVVQIRRQKVVQASFCGV